MQTNVKKTEKNAKKDIKDKDNYTLHTKKTHKNTSSCVVCPTRGVKNSSKQTQLQITDSIEFELYVIFNTRNIIMRGMYGSYVPRNMLHKLTLT